MKSSLNTLIVCLFAVFSYPAFSADYEIEIQNSLNSNALNISFKLNNYKLHKTVIDNSIYSEVFLRESSEFDEKSNPALPRIKKDLAFPKASIGAKLQIKSIKHHSIKADPILPSRGSIMRNQDPSSLSYAESSIYQSNKIFPQDWVSISELGEMRDIKVANLQIHPFRYNFKTKELMILDEVQIEVQYWGEQENVGWGSSLQNLDPSFYNVYKKHFANFPSDLIENLPEESSRSIFKSSKLLIIGNKMFENEMNEYVQWKQMRGFEVFEYYIDGPELKWDRVRDIIKSMYLIYGISYVQLVGDATQMPYHPGKSGNAWGNEADPMYALVSGTDSYPDLFVSRFSVNNISDLRKSIRKSVEYERDPDLNGDWYSEAVGIASDEGSWSGLIDFERLDIVRNLLLGWHYKWIDKVYAPNDETETVHRAVNQGRGFINYIGHGWEQGWVSGSFDNNDVMELENDKKWPFIVSVACVNGRFAYRGGDSFAEAWMNAGTEASPRGAAAIFASSTNQSWVPPTVGQKRISELLTQEAENTIGGLFFNGSIAVLEDGSSTAKQTFETWHIFGDASVQVRTKRPEEIIVKSARLSSVGRNKWLLYLDANSPMVTASALNGSQFLGSGTTGYAGTAYISFENADLRKGDQVLLSLTGFNKSPVQLSLRAQ